MLPAVTLALLLSAQADPQAAWLQANSLTLQLEQEDFSDLAPLQETLKSVRIVQLGEATHGDGASFQVKARLVRFLHEKLGFNVLAWESGFYDVERSPEAGIYALWTRGPHVPAVLEYARSTRDSAHPLRLTGFDIQGSHIGFLTRLYAAVDTPPEDRAVLDAFYRAMSAAAYAPSAAESEERHAALDRARQSLRRVDTREARLLEKAVDNLADFAWHREHPTRHFRDRKMAENLIWLAEDWYPGEKIIVWAASVHVARYLRAVSPAYADFTPMGEWVHQHFGEAAYTVGFTAWSGAFGTPFMEPVPLAEAAEETLERLWHATGQAHAFLSLRGLPADHWLRQPIGLRPFGYVNYRARWPEHLDAVVFSDHMTPHRQK